MTFATRILTAATLLLAPTAFPRAEVPPNGVAHNDAALAALNTLAQQTRQNGTLPRLSDDKGRAVLEDLWNTDASLGKPPYAAADVPKLINILQKQSQVFNAYVNFTPMIGAAPDANKNAATYQDELSHGGAFLMDNAAAALSAMNDFWRTLPEPDRTTARRQGIRQAQQGFSQMITGAALMVRDPAMRQENRTTLTRAIEEYGPTIAASLRPEDRTAIAGAVRPAIEAVPPEDQARLQVFLTALSAPECEGLCTVQ